MASGMNRRHWLRSLAGLVAGAWAAGRAPAAGPPPSPPLVASYDLAAPGPDYCQVSTCTYDCVGRLTRIDGPYVTTTVYDADGATDHG